MFSFSPDDIDCVKKLSREHREQLKQRILAADPLLFFTAKGNQIDSKRKFICPVCGNGEGKDATPAEADFKGDRWLYYCQRACGFGGDILKVIADFRNLNLNEFNDMCTVLAIGANHIGDNSLHGSPSFKSSFEPKQTKPEEAPLIKDDIANAQKLLNEIPAGQKRGLFIDTLQHFGCGYLPRWLHPSCRVDGYKGYVPLPSRRFIIPTDDGLHYNAVALPADRDGLQKKYHKMHAGAKTRFFNHDALTSYGITLLVEGEFDAMSIWQASAGKIPVAATLGVGGYKQILLPLIELGKISRKKFLVLFDGDQTGRARAKDLLDALHARHFIATAKFFADFLAPDDKKTFGDKVDANDLLIKRGSEFLNDLLQNIIADANRDFAVAEKKIADDKHFDDLIRLWRSKHNDADINPKTVVELHDAKKFLDELTPDNFKASFAYNLDYRCKIALLNFYTPELAPKFFSILRDAVSAAKARLKANPFIKDEGTSRIANISPSNIEKEIDVLTTDVKRQQKNSLLDLAREKAEQAEHERWQKKQALPKNPLYRLTTAQIDFLFSLPNSDLDNALRLDCVFGGHIRFLTDCDRWLAFDKKSGSWTRGNSNSVSLILPFAGRLAKSLDQNEPNPDDNPNAKNIVDSWKNNARIGAAINLLKAVDRIRITSDDLNNHPELLLCLNGVVNLQDAKFFENVDPALLITQKTNAAYLPNARDTIVDNFLRSILPDEETRAALVRFLGYSLTGYVSEEKALFIYGKGGNGKGTLTKLAMATFGDFFSAVPVSAVIEANRFKDAGAATTELNVLEKCRLAIVEELPQGGKLDVAKFKSLTGGDKIPVRRLHEEFHHIEPTHKLLLSGNHMPVLSDTRDPGLLRRLLTMNFTADFTRNPDRHLKEKLLTEQARNAFLSLLVNEAVAWHQHGLIESAAMKNATRQYLNSNDFLGEFISEFCTFGKDKSIELKGFTERLREEYRAETRTLTDRALRDLIKRLDGITFGRGKSLSRRTCLIGIGWADSSDDSNSANFPSQNEDSYLPPDDEFDLSQFDN